MTEQWEFKHSFVTSTNRRVAWAFWSDMQNHAEMEAVTIELDGPFQSGTKGRTIAAHSRQEWEISEAIPLRRFVITGREPEFELSFAWDFEDADTGTRMTQTIRATGTETQMQKWGEALHQMEINAPKGMGQLAARLDRLGEF